MRESFLGDGDDNVIMRPLQEHLPLEIDVSTLLCGFECPHQGFVILLHTVVVEQGAKLDFRRAANTLNVSDQLKAFLVQTFLRTKKSQDRIRHSLAR